MEQIYLEILGVSVLEGEYGYLNAIIFLLLLLRRGRWCLLRVGGDGRLPLPLGLLLAAQTTVRIRLLRAEKKRVCVCV